MIVQGGSVLPGVRSGSEGTVAGEEANGAWGPCGGCVVVLVLVYDSVPHVAELPRDGHVSGPGCHLQHTQGTPSVVLGLNLTSLS